MQNSTSNRRPAEIVKCPNCTWTGSARGLHSHCRLMHGKNIKDAKEIKVNPYSIKKKVVKSSIGSVYDKKYRNVDPDHVIIILGLAIFAKWLQNEMDNKTFQSECNKLKVDANNIWSASQV